MLQEVNYSRFVVDVYKSKIYEDINSYHTFENKC